MTDTMKKQEEQKNPLGFRPVKKPAPRRESFLSIAQRKAKESPNAFDPPWADQAERKD